METAFRWATLSAAIVLAATAFAPALVDWLSARGWTTLAPGTEQFFGFVESLGQATGWAWASGLSIGLAGGAWAGWLLRMPFRRTVPDPGVLADDMADMMLCMRSVSEACHSSAYDEGVMVLAYSRFQALQMSLQKGGLRVPWRHWEPGDDPMPYLQANIGYLALVEPLMRKGHMTTAIRTTRRSLRFGGAPRGPLMRVGASLRRVA
jgi:hypothetical protein